MRIGAHLGPFYASTSTRRRSRTKAPLPTLPKNAGAFTSLVYLIVALGYILVMSAVLLVILGAAGWLAWTAITS